VEAEKESSGSEDEEYRREKKRETSDEENLAAEISRRRRHFQNELKEIKKIMNSSSEKKIMNSSSERKDQNKKNSKNFADLSSQLYESANSNTLDLSETQQNSKIISVLNPLS
jgi:hypothetical protein